MSIRTRLLDFGARLLGPLATTRRHLCCAILGHDLTSVIEYNADGRIRTYNRCRRCNLTTHFSAWTPTTTGTKK